MKEDLDKYVKKKEIEKEIKTFKLNSKPNKNRYLSTRESIKYLGVGRSYLDNLKYKKSNFTPDRYSYDKRIYYKIEDIERLKKIRQKRFDKLNRKTVKDFDRKIFYSNKEAVNFLKVNEKYLYNLKRLSDESKEYIYVPTKYFYNGCVFYKKSSIRQLKDIINGTDYYN